MVVVTFEEFWNMPIALRTFLWDKEVELMQKEEDERNQIKNNSKK